MYRYSVIGKIETAYGYTQFYVGSYSSLEEARERAVKVMEDNDCDVCIECVPV